MTSSRLHRMKYLSRKLFIFLLILIVFTYLGLNYFLNMKPKAFDSEKAYRDVIYQVSLGPRIIGSEAHQSVQAWIIKELKDAGWKIETQTGNISNITINNIIGKQGTGNQWIILGAHYDSRIFADRDTDASKQQHSVPGANDGASGVAILLELARTLPNHFGKQIWLVFFDAEDNGNINGYEWSMGSRYFVSKLVEKPEQVIIIDMIGDKDLDIYYEKNSDYSLSQSIWNEAARLGYPQFIPSPKHSILDDHIPFIEAGITAIDIIDFDYPYWHTTNDTPDKVSSQSLKAVGDTLLSWLIHTK